MLILLTNDDGANAEGLLTLREALLKRYDVVTCAPETERTCTGHAITLHKPLRIRQIEEGFYATNGTPADCIILGVRILLKKRPDLVISGINKGPNMGRDIYYSGTVAAAKEGAFLGVPSIAFSMNARENVLFGEGVKIVERMLKHFDRKTFPQGLFLNVNIPNIRAENIRGFAFTRLGKRKYTESVVERVDPRGGKYYWIGSNGQGFEPLKGTDFYAVSRGYVSITPLSLDDNSATLRGSIKKSLGRLK